jgi:hypothetical protein
MGRRYGASRARLNTPDGKTTEWKVANILDRNFDLVIVDEAHHLRDRASQSYKLVDKLNKRFFLLLSATPVLNDLTELYNLLTLLKPGIFKTLKEFRAAHVMAGKPRQPARCNSDGSITQSPERSLLAALIRSDLIARRMVDLLSPVAFAARPRLSYMPLCPSCAVCRGTLSSAQLATG